MEEYQQVLISLKESSGGEVRGEMIDRILDGGELAFWHTAHPIKRSLCEDQDQDRDMFIEIGRLKRFGADKYSHSATSCTQGHPLDPPAPSSLAFTLVHHLTYYCPCLPRWKARGGGDR